MRTGDGDVSNTISGGTLYGLALQGRDFTGIAFTTPPPPSADPGAGTPPQS
ncbi:hypothetical protein [Streptomyces spectabilis]|uniref:Uncharacterized protein n=1 Tax=Streptomyces spectabilis TaxID=68270 RepID=A0A7W8B703_STRST|nr:hypothetical protein [Streptomyces spectabilis]MBB5110002.1 hypothetical protein [Streptomyces spectabilis]GGV57472.1 hypothetical protein GCM10010245_90590 [Streptomyces spectabilis]